jgi:predicted DCC family thiol-disulfide oxidoreductase YuxK
VTGPGPGRLTVLYDAGCPLCRAARHWLAGRAQLVPLEFVEAGSAAARRRFRGLDHARTLAEVTVVADTGAVYEGDSAWLVCLWALDGYRALALRLSSPRLRPLARRVVQAAAASREGTTSTRYGRACDDACQRP